MTRVVLVALALAGCSSMYFPRSRGRVAVTIRDGKPVYVRDGIVYEAGVLGGGLSDAVAGNPAAMAAANEYSGRITTGVIGLLVGLAGFGGGAGWAIHDAAVSNNTPNLTGPALLGIGGLVLALVGTLYASTAEPYRWDAINLFNDAQP
jgi:hypothetical protein